MTLNNQTKIFMISGGSRYQHQHVLMHAIIMGRVFSLMVSVNVKTDLAGKTVLIVCDCM